jgi:hypothetical protein
MPIFMRIAVWSWLFGLAIPAPLACAQNRTTDFVLTGRAVTGTDSRDVRATFTCSGNQGPDLTGVLSIVLEVPDVATLKPVFDFEPFEGPDAHAGARSHVAARANGALAQADFTASGSIPAEPDTSFDLEVTAARRGEPRQLAALARVLRPLTTGPGMLEWRQGNARRNEAPIVATFHLTAADAASLSVRLDSCLDQPAR